MSADAVRLVLAALNVAQLVLLVMLTAERAYLYRNGCAVPKRLRRRRRRAPR